MTDTVVCGIDHHREWMLHVVSCDCVTGARRDFMWFFNTRAEAEARLKCLVRGVEGKNILVKIIKVRAFEHLEPNFQQTEKKEN